MLLKKIYTTGDKFEDRVREKLSHYPIIYALIGGTGVVIFWRGIWNTADLIMDLLFVEGDSVSRFPWWDGPLSILIGSILLLIIGLFVTSLIGNEIIISGLRKEKKLVERTEGEIRLELEESDSIKNEIHEMNNKLKRLEEKLK
ncbi:MAG: hypothetical protein WCJ57_01435 [Candidatus Falkowbacteria bacterium]